MPSIKVLPVELRNKIAAGEVVERPASVVKELADNAIDAGASRIEVEVGYGGRKLIRISDDGAGMDKEDALLSIQRHATSKLSSEDDLFNIKTMGFRGEALSSIASVSKFALRTSLKGAPSGVSVKVIGGEVVEIKEAPPGGTTVEAGELFYNVPARKKFLKKDSTELHHIIETVTALSLSHPAIGFVLVSDGKKLIELPRAGGLKERLLQVYGAEFLDGLIEFSRRTDGMRMEVFFSRPGNLRDSRSNQYVFVNGRPVREPLVSSAIYGALEAPQGKHPIFFVFMEIDPRRVDFNVHPAKREIRFEDRDAVYRFVRRGLAEALMGAAAAPSDSQGATNPFSATFEGNHSFRPFSGGVAEAAALSYGVELPFIYLGDTFLALAEGGGLTIIDCHAAHERVLYERLLEGAPGGAMQLLFPRQIKLSPKEYAVILEHRGVLLEMGIEVEDFGGDTVVVRSLPREIGEADLRGVLSDAAAELISGERPGRTLREAVAARVACHGSIRGKRPLSGEALRALLDDLKATANPRECPHGRPTKIFYSPDDLKRLFKRK